MNGYEDVCVYTQTYTNAMEYYSIIKKNDILPFEIIWKILEIITPSEVRERKRNTPSFHLYVESKIREQKNTYIMKQTHRHREQSAGYQWWEGRQEGQDRGIRLRVTNYYVSNISNKGMLYSTKI